MRFESCREMSWIWPSRAWDVPSSSSCDRAGCGIPPPPSHFPTHAGTTRTKLKFAEIFVAAWKKAFPWVFSLPAASLGRKQDPTGLRFWLKIRCAVPCLARWPPRAQPWLQSLRCDPAKAP